MSHSYLASIRNGNVTPQSEPIPGKSMVQNSAGGYAFQINEWDFLNRFLILGTEGGSYYASERKLTKDAANHTSALIKKDGPRVVKTVVEISDAGRAAKNDPALFVLAMCMAEGDQQTRALAGAALPKVARIGTHLFHFAEYVNGMRGWGRGLRNAVGGWYLGKSESALALQAVKYQQRDGWSHADLLRLAHPVANTDTRNDIFKYMVDGWPSVGSEPHSNDALKVIWAHETAKHANESELISLIQNYNLPMECIPTDKRTRGVYEALIPTGGLTWLIRNLGNLSKTGAIAEGQWGNVNQVVSRITDMNALKSQRVHPLMILQALKTYQSGRSLLGSGSWPVVNKVVDALNDAFYLAFDAIEPSNKRFVLAFDISGSMDMGEVVGMKGINPRTAAAAMGMATYRTEPMCVSIGFTSAGGYSWARRTMDDPNSGITSINMNANERLDSLISRMRALPMGGTDCAQPMLWAMKNNVEADAFVVYTDNETWAGNIHPVQALRQYRDKTGIPARLIVVGMVTNGFTIADSSDKGMLDIVGFDTSAPSIMSEFVKGNV